MPVLIRVNPWRNVLFAYLERLCSLGFSLTRNVELTSGRRVLRVGRAGSINLTGRNFVQSSESDLEFDREPQSLRLSFHE
jgi:hypothetical protein